MKKNNVIPTMSKLYTKLVKGKLIVFIRHYWLGNYNKWYFYKDEDTIVSSTPITNPILQWNGEPFLDYPEYFIGNLSYKEYCKEPFYSSIFCLSPVS